MTNKKKDKASKLDDEIINKEPSGSFAWKVLLPSQINLLLQCKTAREMEEKMAECLGYTNYQVDLKQACLLDVFTIAFHWAKQQGFDARQLSGFVTLLSSLLSNIKDKRMGKLENLRFLRECFSGIGSDTPDVVPIPLYFFTSDHGKAVLDYLINSVIKQYSLFEYIHAEEQDELIVGTDLLVEVCPEVMPYPAPLEEALPASTFEDVSLYQQEKEERELKEKEASLTEQFTDAVLSEVEASEIEAVKTIPTTEIRKLIEKFTKEMILPAQIDIENKIKDRESSYMSKIAKLMDGGK